MKNLAAILSMLLLMAGLAPTGWGADEPVPFDAFKIILERNIFDASRQAKPPPSQRPRAEIRPDRITLLGVLVDGKDSAAFFDGSRSEYTRVVRMGEDIAGHKVVAIGTDKVLLANGDKKIELKVASRMERIGDNPWTLAAGGSNTSERFQEEPSSSSTTGSDGQQSDSAITSGSAASTSPESSSDLVKRLMERRRREMGE